jgi:exodeoxyribonuclease-3
MHIVREWLMDHRPDALCLQETKVQDHEFPLEPFQAAGYHVSFKGAKAHAGVAIITRETPANVTCGFDDGGTPDGARLIRITLGGIHIVNTYVPQGRDPDSPHFTYKLEWFTRLKRLFQLHYSPDEPVLWCGDLNVAPEPLDVYDSKKLMGHVCHRPEATRALYDVVEWGFTDLFRRYHPEGGHYTYFDYRVKHAVERKIGWRVDHIFATEPLVDKSVSCYIDPEPRKKEKPSDHTCIVAEFGLP